MKENKECIDNSESLLGSYYLQVPNTPGIAGFAGSGTNIENKSLPKEKRKRSNSFQHVPNSGSSTPTRKFSLTSVGGSKSNLSRIKGLSSNFLSASFSNIHRSSSAKSLLSFFTHNFRGVRTEFNLDTY